MWIEVLLKRVEVRMKNEKVEIINIDKFFKDFCNEKLSGLLVIERK